MRLFMYLTEKEKILKKKWSTIDLSKIPDEQLSAIWEMYTSTYSKEGLTFSSDKNELKRNYKATAFTNVNDSPDAFIIYTPTKYGNKISLLGHNGSPDSKKLLIDRLKFLLNTNGWIMETSKKIEKLCNSFGVPFVVDAVMVERILSQPVDWIDKGHYRTKSDKSVVKKMYGVPKNN